jgi:hypothetical protein
MLKEYVATALEFANRPVHSYEDMPEGPAAFSVPELQNLVRAGNGNPLPLLDDAIKELIPGLDIPNVYQASRIAQIIGTFVEWGATPGMALEPLLGRMDAQVSAARRFVHKYGTEPTNLAYAFSEDPDDFAAWRGLTFMGLAAMTMLARSVSGRQIARQRTTLWEELRALADELADGFNIAWYLSEMLSVDDELKVLVLNLDKRQGHWVKLTAVRNNFHFFTLLQCALGISNSSTQVCLAARGEHETTQQMSDNGVYTYLVWDGLLPDGKVNPIALAWGEMMPSELPRFQGVPILLLTSGGPARSWDGGFFASLHEALRSSVDIEQVLDNAEVEDWIGRIRAAPRN